MQTRDSSLVVRAVRSHVLTATGSAPVRWAVREISASEDGLVRLWDVVSGGSTGAPLQESRFGAVNDVAFSPDGTVLASASEDGQVSLWDTTSRQQLGKISPDIAGRRMWRSMLRSPP